MVAPNAWSRAARCEATESRVACSRPSGVKYIARRQLAELVHGPAPQLGLGERGRAQRGVGPGGRAVQPVAGAEGVRLVDRLGRLQQLLTLVGQQPAQGVDVHAVTLSGTPLLRVLVSELALSC